MKEIFANRCFCSSFTPTPVADSARPPAESRPLTPLPGGPTSGSRGQSSGVLGDVVRSLMVASSWSVGGASAPPGRGHTHCCSRLTFVGATGELTPENRRHVQQLPARNRWNTTVIAQLVAEETWKMGKIKRLHQRVCVSATHTHTLKIRLD